MALVWLLALFAVAEVVRGAEPPIEEDRQGFPVFDASLEPGNKEKYQIYVGQWSECNETAFKEHFPTFYNDRDSSDSLVSTPEPGLQYREVKCRAHNGTFIDPVHCGGAVERIGTSRVCVVIMNCILGEWLPWRPRPDGSLVRTRRVRRLPQGDPSCDVLEEVRPAVLEPSGHWVPGPWGSCKVAVEQPATSPPAPDDESDDAAIDDAIYEDDNEIQDDIDDRTTSTEASCGGGVQRREVTCMSANRMALHPAQCAHTVMPTLVQPCEVPCPRDCEVGEWSEWGACQPTDGCPLYPVQQLTTTGFSVRRRRVISAASGGGSPCPPLEEKRTCAAPRCASWQALPWGPCVLNQPHDTCGPGKRTRELRCVGHDGKEAERAWCTAVGAPARTERCRIACPGDCVVSAWGPWAACSAPCTTAKHDHPVPTTTRRRHILAHAAPNGWPCPSPEQLIQNETCNTHACATYSWLATPWGPCEPRTQDYMPPTNYTELSDTDPYNESDEEEPCVEEGEMTRDVMCVQNNADVVRESLCAPLSRPASRRACTVRCHRGCRVEAWQPWSPCPNTCEPGKQFRVRVVHGGPNCGALREERPCAVPATCGARTPKWVAGEWSACLMAPEQKCGIGYTIRSIWCGSESHRVEEAECAGQKALHNTMLCNIPCNYSTSVTDSTKRTQALSEFHACEPICADPIRYLDSTDPNLPSCVCKNVTLELLPSDSDCILPPGMECGEGRALRAARCMVKGLHVPMAVCEKYHPLTGPNRVREASTDGYTYDEEFPELLRGACTVRCARDCAAGPWGEWGPCAAEPGSRSAFRFRTREVIEEGSGGGRECGATLQRATCVVEEPRWEVREWSPCVPHRSLCGRAIITRNVTCVDTKGKRLADSVCETSGAGHTPLRQLECRAPCPSDCVVSEWSDWSPCEKTKWGGRRDRTRVVLRGALPGGVACPALVAAQPCTPHTYSWHVSPYDDCQPLGGSPCGEGIKRRAVRCHRSDGVFVDDSFCQNTTAMMESREAWCYVPCGVDCALGEWGPWDSSACECGDTSSTKHMRRLRQHLTAAVWPGRACPPTEQRAPCPREPCFRLVSTEVLGCHIHTTASEEAAGTCGWGVVVNYARCHGVNPGIYPSDNGLILHPSRCIPVIPGRIFPPPEFYWESKTCKVECGCKEEDVRETPGPWGPWGPCQQGARSRTRHVMIVTAPAQCFKFRTSRLVTVQWSNCTNDGEIPDLEAVEPRDDHPRRGWIERDHDRDRERDRDREVDHNGSGHYYNGYSEGSSSVLALVWTSTIILWFYGIIMIYQGCVRRIRNRRMKTIAKV